MASTKPPFKPLRAAHIDYQPSATCLTVDDADTPCPFKCSPGPNTIDNVKYHVAHTGHAVAVTRTTISRYVGVVR